jgi:hypothetical protein
MLAGTGLLEEHANAWDLVGVPETLVSVGDWRPAGWPELPPLGLRQLLLSIPLIAGLADCHSRSPAEEATKQLETAESWSATAALIGERWLAGAVPAPYTRDALRAAATGLEDELSAVGSASLPSGTKATLAASMVALDTAVTALRAAVGANDRALVARRIDALLTEQRAVRATAGAIAAR